MSRNIVLSFDDFSLQHSMLETLRHLEQEFTIFKCTLFTIPNKTPVWLQKMAIGSKFIQLAVHGFNHTLYEFATLTYQETKKIIEQVDTSLFVKGFKAPNWRISKDAVQYLTDNGYWIALHEPNDIQLQTPEDKRPDTSDKSVYYFYNCLASRNFKDVSGDFLIQGHLSFYEGCNDNIIDCYSNLLSLPKDVNFLFVDEYMKGQNAKSTNM